MSYTNSHVPSPIDELDALTMPGRVQEAIKGGRENDRKPDALTVATTDTVDVESSAVTRRERIAFLLAHYSDVLAGVRDRGLGGEHLPLMCSAWNHPSYQELERLLPLLGYDMRPLYRAVMGMYVHPRFVRRAVCPRCGPVSAPGNVGELHRHNHRSVVLVARSVASRTCPMSFYRS